MKTNTPVYVNNDGIVVTTTLKVAELFGKNHEDVLNEVTRLLEEEKKESEEDGGKAEDGELCKDFKRVYVTGPKSIIHVVYEMTKDGFDYLIDDYTGSDIPIKEAITKEFNRIDPPILRCLEGITEKEQKEAVLTILDSNDENSRLFKQATLREFNNRAKIISLQQKEIFELHDKLKKYGL